MKNNELQEINPVYIYESGNVSKDEINLVELALVLVNRKKLISIIFISFVILGIAAALFIPKQYAYSTPLEIGSQIISGSIEPFESAQTLLAKLQHSFIPQTINEHHKSNPEDDKEYEIQATIPKNSDIIVLKVNDTQAQAALMKNMLKNITNKAVDNHTRIFDSVKKNLISQLEQAKAKLKDLGSGPDNYSRKASLQRSIESYSGQLSNLRNTNAISPPMQSIEPSGFNNTLIIAISAFVGLFIAVFSAYFAEFIVKVREKQLNISNE